MPATSGFFPGTQRIVSVDSQCICRWSLIKATVIRGYSEATVISTRCSPEANETVLQANRLCIKLDYLSWIPRTPKIAKTNSCTLSRS